MAAAILTYRASAQNSFLIFVFHLLRLFHFFEPKQGITSLKTSQRGWVYGSEVVFERNLDGESSNQEVG